MMTPRSERLIEALHQQREDGAWLAADSVARDLRLAGLPPTEAGWVLRHVFGISMPEAIHMAKVSAESVEAELSGTEYADAFPERLASLGPRPHLGQRAERLQTRRELRALGALGAGL